MDDRCALRRLGNATCNTPVENATGRATITQRPTLKARAAGVLTRNGARNDDATPMQQREQQTRATVASVPAASANGANDLVPPTTATWQQAAELRDLITLVFADADDTERAEVLAVARADPEAALMSFRTLAADLRPKIAPLVHDDRRPCTRCANLTAGGHCLAAQRGLRIGNAGRDYSPVRDLPRRCEGYAPMPSEADQRTGAERWPFIAEDARRIQEMARGG